MLSLKKKVFCKRSIFMENIGIPKDIFVEKISKPMKKVREAIQSKNKEELIAGTDALMEGIDFCMNGPWMCTEIFRGLNNLYRWAYSEKMRAQKI